MKRKNPNQMIYIEQNYHIKRFRQLKVKLLIKQKKRMIALEKAAQELEDCCRENPGTLRFLAFEDALNSGDIKKTDELFNSLTNCSSIVKINWDKFKALLKKAKRQVNHYEPRTESKEA